MRITVNYYSRKRVRNIVISNSLTVDGSQIYYKTKHKNKNFLNITDERVPLTNSKYLLIKDNLHAHNKDDKIICEGAS